MEMVESLNVEKKSTPLVYEITGASLRLQEKDTLFVLAVYCPPHQNRDLIDQAFQLLSGTMNTFLSTDSSKVLIISDVNVDNLLPSSARTLFNDILTSYNMTRQSLPATRITPTWESSIDAVCTNLSKDLNREEVLSTAISERTGQISISSQENLTTSTRRHFNADNILSLRENLSKTNWEAVLRSVSAADEAYNILMLRFMESLDLTCPLKKSMQNHNLKNSSKFDPEARYPKEEFIDAESEFLLTNSVDDKQYASQTMMP